MMYTGDSLRKRLRLRNHATVLAAIDRWWAISRKSISGSGMDAFQKLADNPTADRTDIDQFRRIQKADYVVRPRPHGKYKMA